MLDNRIREFIDPPIETMGERLAELGFTANAVTFAGFLLGAVSAIAIGFSAFWTGLFLLLLSRLCDGLDGAVARATRKTDLGGFLDIVLDFAFYGMIPAAFIFADPAQNALAGTALLTAFYVNGASFLTYALMAEKRGLDETERGSKSLLYTTGLAEATETIGVFVLMCLFPGWFPVFAWVFAAVTAYTTFSRIMLARQSFRDG